MLRIYCKGKHAILIICPSGVPVDCVAEAICDVENVHAMVGPLPTSEGHVAILFTNEIVAMAADGIHECIFEGTTHYVQANALDKGGLERTLDGMELRWSFQDSVLVIEDAPESAILAQAELRVTDAVARAKKREEFLAKKANEHAESNNQLKESALRHRQEISLLTSQKKEMTSEIEEMKKEMRILLKEKNEWETTKRNQTNETRGLRQKIESLMKKQQASPPPSPEPKEKRKKKKKKKSKKTATEHAGSEEGDAALLVDELIKNNKMAYEMITDTRDRLATALIGSTEKLSPKKRKEIDADPVQYIVSRFEGIQIAMTEIMRDPSMVEHLKKSNLIQNKNGRAREVDAAQHGERCRVPEE